MSEETAPETGEVIEAAAQETTRPARSKAGVWAGLALATGLGGFALAWFDPMDWRGGAQIAELQAQVAALSATLAKADETRVALEGRIGNLEAAPDVVPAPDPALEGRLAAAEAALAAIRAEFAGLATAPGGVTEAALQAAVDKAMAEWAAAEAGRSAAVVSEDQAKAVQAAALEVIRAAALTGAPYAESLAALGGVEVPEPLQRHAGTGMPTLAGLTEAFPEAARAALDASLRATADDSLTGRLLGFLRVQTGARSLEPREGSDPDAVLSRAEAAVKAGDVARALTELGALPPEGLAEMKAWLDQAGEYQSVQQALVALAASLGQ